MQTVKEVRPIKHTYVCNEERNVMCQSVLTQTEMRVCQMQLCTKLSGAGLLTQGAVAEASEATCTNIIYTVGD